VNEERLYQIILAPRISEKSSMVADKHQQFVFDVATDATKPEIKKAVEKMFEVEVASVQVANMKGKVKRFGQTLGRRKGLKKAYVRLKAGQDIDFSGLQK
jgi:large subunit ribosomal protein L23